MAAIILSFGVPAFAQSTGAIQGTVMDATSSPIPNASVSIKSETTGQERTLVTDSAGIYFAPVPAHRNLSRRSQGPRHGDHRSRWRRGPGRHDGPRRI